MQESCTHTQKKKTAQRTLHSLRPYPLMIPILPIISLLRFVFTGREPQNVCVHTSVQGRGHLLDAQPLPLGAERGLLFRRMRVFSDPAVRCPFQQLEQRSNALVYNSRSSVVSWSADALETILPSSTRRSPGSGIAGRHFFSTRNTSAALLGLL